MDIKNIYLVFSIFFSVIAFMYSLKLYKNAIGKINIIHINDSIINTIIFLIPTLNILPENGILNRAISVYCILAIIFNISIKKEKNIFKSINVKAVIIIAIFYTFLLLSTLLAKDITIAKTIYLQQIQYVTIGIYLIFSNKPYKIDITIKIIILSSILIIIPSVLQIITGQSDIGLFDVYNSNTFQGRVSGPFGDSLHLTQYLGVMIAIIMGYSYRYKNIRKLKKYCLNILLSILIIILFYNQSKIGIFSIITIYTIFLLIYYKNKKIKLFAIIIFISTMVFNIFYIKGIEIYNLDIFKRFLDIKQSTNTRLMFWKSGIEIFKDNILGVGLGNYRNVVHEYLPASLIEFRFSGGIAPTIKRSSHAESTYFTFLAEGGLQLTIMYIYIILNCMKKSLRNISIKYTSNQFIALAMLLSWIVILIDGISLNNFFIKPIQTQFWVIYALTSNLVLNNFNLNNKSK